MVLQLLGFPEAYEEGWGAHGYPLEQPRSDRHQATEDPRREDRL